MNCAIIGAGQLGSRHLQGLLTVKNQTLNIFVIDPSSESLAVAEQRAKEIDGDHKLTFATSINELPSQLEFVVIATNSMMRLAVMQALLNNKNVNNLILEKVLFPTKDQYGLAYDLIKKHNVNCWVNHPRRMYEDYQNLKQLFNKDKIYSFQLVGGSWGLACNGLHFIDLFEYLTEGNLTSVSNALLNGNPIESKRVGYLEFAGTLTGTLDNKHSFSITSYKSEKPVAPSMCIMTDSLKIFIQESATPKIYCFNDDNNFRIEELNFHVKFQSQLTGKLFEQIQNTGTCDLPSFEHAASTHQIFIESILNRWNLDTKANNTALPIT